MHCKISRQLADFQVGLLEARTRERIEQHLEHCPACRAELQALQRTADLLAPMPLAEAPRDTWLRVQSRLTPRHRHQHTAVRAWVPAVAAVMLLMIVGMAFMGPLMNAGAPALPLADDGYAQIQVAADWDNPLADKAALGLAMLAMEQEPAEEALN